MLHRLMKASFYLLPLLIFLSLSSACSDSKPARQPSKRGGAVQTGKLVISLPNRDQMSQEEKSKLTGFHLRLQPAVGCVGNTTEATYLWSKETIEAELLANCDYLAELQLGEISFDTKNLTTVYFESSSGSDDYRIPRDKIAAGALATPVSIPLHLTAAGVAAGFAAIEYEPLDSLDPEDPSTQIATVDQSNGSGGRTGRFEESYKASNGQTSKYRMSVPPDSGPAKAYGLLIYLHGDGAGDYRQDWVFNPLEKLGLEKGLMMVSILSPDGGNQWYSDGKGHAAYVNGLIQDELYKKYNIDKRHIFFTGSSGGSQFLTGSFVPLYGVNYRGGAMPTCGGATNWEGGFQPTSEFLAGFQLFFYTQTFDFLYSQVKEAISYYKSKGLTVHSETPFGGRHCGFDTEMAVRKGLDLILQP